MKCCSAIVTILSGITLSVFVGYLSAAAHGQTAVTDTVASAQLAEVIADYWESELVSQPLYATRVGDHRFNDRLADVSLAGHAARYAKRQTLLKRLDAIGHQQLAADQLINYEILKRILQVALDEYRFRAHLIPITGRDGFHIDFPDLRLRSPLKTVRDFENYIARLAAFREYAAQHIELMKQGLADGFTLPSVVLEDYDVPIKAQIVDDPEDSLFFEPLKSMPESIDAATQARLRAAVQETITTSIVPGYRDFLAFMSQEYVPRSREGIGAAALPDGRAFYRHRVRRFTTLDLLPEEIHQTGLREVERIRGEMQGIIQSVKFEGDFAEFLQFLRNDPQFYATSPEQLLREVAMVLKQIDGQLPKLFQTLPRTPYGIRKVPDYIAPRTTTAYYMQPAGDGTEAGFYYVNTFNLKSRPLYEVPALSLHEAVPGHHLQIALAQEMPGVPAFRRFVGLTAFVEGWALYAERLGLEVGFYEDPYEDFGRLTYEMWRACRLVVDTGIHYLGWSRQQAIDFMAKNTALSLHNIRAEVDRYIAWPGQALAYKIGELEIRRLRTMAEQELGDRFDVREFHDVVLSAGAIPLELLAARVNDYVRQQAPAQASGDSD